MLEVFAPWAPFFEFSVKPIVPNEKSTPILEKAFRMARFCTLIEEKQYLAAFEGRHWALARRSPTVGDTVKLGE